MTVCTHCPEFLTGTRLFYREGYSRIQLPAHYQKTWTQLPTLHPDLGHLHHHLTTALKEHLILQLSADWRNTASYLPRITSYWEKNQFPSFCCASYGNKVPVLSSEKFPSLKKREKAIQGLYRNGYICFDTLY